MIILRFLLYLALATGNVCNLGRAADYYPWVDAHNYRVLLSIEWPRVGDLWVMTGEGDSSFYVFKFKQEIRDTISSGKSHGECFRQLP